LRLRQGLHKQKQSGGLGAKRQALNSQTLAAFGAASIDHSATTTGLHANQKAMRTGAAGFRRLISAFHDWNLLPIQAMPGGSGKTQHYRWFKRLWQAWGAPHCSA
jgi:hypothetical protein